jgi:DNA topoisomerase-1
MPVLDSDQDAAIVDPRDAAKMAGLRYVADSQPGIRRKKSGAGFCYVQPDGSKVVDKTVLDRIRSVVIPPAWSDVWICRFANGHIQATGRDARRRKQYRPQFREVRESTKFEHIMTFARLLPIIRINVREHTALRGLPRKKILATVVHLLEATLIRVGNDDYARQNDSYGLTPLRNRHVAVDGSQLRFQFTGKGGKKWSVAIKDRRVAKIIKACQELPGQELLQYVDDEGNLQDVSSADVNEYLQQVTGENVTAKDFRTWGARISPLWHSTNSRRSTAPRRRKKPSRGDQTRCIPSWQLTICRKCYVHPEVLNAYVEGSLLLEMKTEAERELRETLEGLSAEEAAVLASLRGRLESKASGRAA